jgi:hypothetical protein
MIGSETFIMVAFRCTEYSTSSALACSIVRARNSLSAEASIRVASTISPARTWRPSFSVVVPSAVSSTIDRVSSAGMVTDFSLLAKSCSPIVATLVFEPSGNGLLVCGCDLAYFFTDAGARRSELPSRSTGLTAEPLTLSYFSRASRSASLSGDSG